MIQPTLRQLIKSVADLSPDAALGFDLQGQILFSNQSACSTLALTETQLKQLSVFDINPTLTHKQWQRFWDFLKQKKSHSFESTHQFNRDAVTPITIAATYIEYLGLECIYANAKELIQQNSPPASLQLEATAFNASSEAVIITDANGFILTVNPAFASLTGYSSEESVGATPHILKSSRHDTQFYNAITEKVAATGHWHGGLWGRRKDGKEFAAQLTIDTVYNDAHKATQHVALFSDVTEEQKTIALISRHANYDRLTDLPNRALFFNLLSHELSQARRNGKFVAVFIIDLDNFKPVNDTFGHEAGDVVLKIVARRWRSCVRETDTIARLGGDEFALILGNLNSPDEITSIAEKMLGALKQKIELPSGDEYQMGASIGIALYPENAMEIDSLMAAADEAMYKSKAAEKNIYTLAKVRSNSRNKSPEWFVLDSSYLVGFGLIDKQHQQLVNIMNKLNRSIRSNTSDLKDAFDEFFDFTLFHFKTEHQLMKMHQYPEQSSHEAEHAKLFNELQFLAKRFNEGNEFLALQLVKDWLIDHITYSDKALGAFLTAKTANCADSENTHSLINDNTINRKSSYRAHSTHK